MRFDHVFVAQQADVPRLLSHGVRARWLPLACDPAIHRKHEVEKRYDLCFLGNLSPGQRHELVWLLQEQFHSTFVGRQYFDNPSPPIRCRSPLGIKFPISIMTPAQTVDERLVYDPYGKPTTLTSAWASFTDTSYFFRVLFQGEQWLNEANVYQMGARDFDFTVGAWDQQDPAGYIDGSSLYRAFDSNPVVLTDPSGLNPPFDLGPLPGEPATGRPSTQPSTQPATGPSAEDIQTAADVAKLLGGPVGGIMNHGQQQAQLVTKAKRIMQKLNDDTAQLNDACEQARARAEEVIQAQHDDAVEQNGNTLARLLIELERAGLAADRVRQTQTILDVDQTDLSTTLKGLDDAHLDQLTEDVLRPKTPTTNP
jgi:RHS repeat-associated protein